MPADTSNRGFPIIGQVGMCAIAAAILFRGLRLPVVASCFAGLIAAAMNYDGAARGEPVIPAPAPRDRLRPRASEITVASEDSFPASDPPSWTPVGGTRSRH